ncbi:MAG: metalloregulator ArsR/SmtB family transcription factor [Tissierellaceae bacterium]|nr:metalloregulator ArsR/SmtB family transcription factor [Tissierellaceae bacterium]
MDRKTVDKFKCLTHEGNEKALERLKENLLKEDGICILSNIFKAISDPTRLKIIYVLSKSNLCVCNIAYILDMSQSAISHQLRILRDLKLVKFVKKGKLVIYSLDDDHVLQLLTQGLDHVKHK